MLLVAGTAVLDMAGELERLSRWAAYAVLTVWLGMVVVDFIVSVFDPMRDIEIEPRIGIAAIIIITFLYGVPAVIHRRNDHGQSG